MSDSAAGPVRYFHGQNLTVGDFVDEQRFHVAMQRRHNIGPHSWGIVEGLELRLNVGEAQEQATLEILPGYAVDGYGRELVLPAKLDVDVDLTSHRRNGTTVLDIALTYRARQSEIPVASAETPAPSSAARWDETPELSIVPLTQVDDAALSQAFSPEMSQPWSDNVLWPVPLGRLRIDAPIGADLTVDPATRRYAGLIGQDVRPPDGRARIAFGAGGSADAPPFAVLLEDEDGEGDAPPAPRRALWVASDSRLHAGLPVSLSGGLRLNGGALCFNPGPEPQSPPEGKGGRITRIEGGPNEASELRIELPDGPNGQLSLGAWSETQKRYKPAFTVQSDGTVRIAGNLIVQGLINPPAEAEATTPAEHQIEAGTQAAFTSAVAAQAAEAAIANARQSQGGLLAWLAGLIKRLLAAFNLGPDAHRAKGPPR